MAVQVSYPGVYIEEFAPGAPIQGVSTAIAAFIGLAQKGEMDKPTKITSWDQFVESFGEQPAPGSCLPYAVRGFFDNGGQACYIVRASNGVKRRGELLNRADVSDDNKRRIAWIRSRQPGSSVPPNGLTITPKHLIENALVYRPTGNALSVTGRTLQMASAEEAGRFRPGDWLDVGSRRIQAVRVSGDKITLAESPSGVGANAEVRLADTRPGDRTLRIRTQTGAALDPDMLIPGSVLTLTLDDDVTETQVVDSVQAEYMPTAANGDPKVTYRVNLREGLVKGFAMTEDVPVVSEEIDVRVLTNGTGPLYTGLGLDPAHRRYYVDVLKKNDTTIEVEPVEPPPPFPFSQNLPAEGTTQLAAGTDEDLQGITSQDYIDALDMLREVDEVSLVAIPGVHDATVQQAMIAHCELLADRFAILDSAPGIGLFGPENSIEAQRRSVDSTRGYAGLYYPWLKTKVNGRTVTVPPSGHICGVIARVDAGKGVHKAPANETINGAFDVEKTMSNQDQGLLNLQGINVIRVFQKGGRPYIWGARTTATDRNWQYVNIRRLFLFLEESIQEGINWAVFEPNNKALWAKLKRSISDFLERAWRDGALFGSTAKDAFYVRIDEALNPFSDRSLGRLTIEIGVQPTYPAEFIVVRIGIWDGGAVTEE